MKHVHLVLVVLIAALVTACATRQEPTQMPEPEPEVKVAPANAKENVRKEPPAKEVAVKPVSSSKFSRLKVGMTLKQVEQLIGSPASQRTHATDKVNIPFYFGPDRWVIHYVYKGEGVLTFNSGGEQLLTLIEVNKAE